VDGLTLYANWGGGAFTARAVARAGRLLLRQGDWQGEPVLDAAWVARSTTAAGTPLPDRRRDPAPAAGVCGYSNDDGVWPVVPRDAFAGAGAGHQLLLVVPSLDLIVVRNGQALSGERREGFWGPLYRHLFVPLLDALS
jgi:CubicO group peptidase (beta-lactamase class C family)